MSNRIAHPVVTAGGVLVVFDDACRLRWESSSSNTWTLGATWPTPLDRLDVDAHLARGGCLLVITDGHDIITNAWPHELTADSSSHAVNGAFDEMVEIRVDHFDWLPTDLRQRGDLFVARERTRWSREPAILRPALTLDIDIDTSFHDPGQIVFAMTAPGSSRGWVEREVVRFLEHIQARQKADASR